MPENEFAKGLQRLYQSCKHSITHVNLFYFTSEYLGMVVCEVKCKKHCTMEGLNLCVLVSVSQPHMPLFSIYSLALEQDQEQSVGLQQANTTLHNQTFIQVSSADIR